MIDFKIQAGSWSELAQDAMQIRRDVFILEQHIPEDEEWDALDASALHFVVYVKEKNQVQAIATARLLANNSIGRVAVLKAYRGQGIGRILMLKIIEQAKFEQRVSLKLSSQVHAIPFYESLGFAVQGDEYLDCGIPHIDMTLSI
ncbi:GNAT family N-acetyltransferase [Acinetobacter lanii]|uniref:GNAT family N-acetyltransferase n=1 Tax=Acinetobacter lanii TaxID=2715163 RepID=A0A6G8S6Y4_9GAMM|nr:GNAT family N-acetyltransferase [Acinetobacter lanii]QIO09713.1 GNAT family N-acetyltransferase [Acinetobacter lanii]